MGGGVATTVNAAARLRGFESQGYHLGGEWQAIGNTEVNLLAEVALSCGNYE